MCKALLDRKSTLEQSADERLQPIGDMALPFKEGRCQGCNLPLPSDLGNLTLSPTTLLHFLALRFVFARIRSRSPPCATIATPPELTQLLQRACSRSCMMITIMLCDKSLDAIPCAYSLLCTLSLYSVSFNLQLAQCYSPLCRNTPLNTYTSQRCLLRGLPATSLLPNAATMYTADGAGGVLPFLRHPWLVWVHF
jgi:hypothetical protein